MLICDKLLQELCLTYRLDIPGHVRSSQLGILEGKYLWIVSVIIKININDFDWHWKAFNSLCFVFKSLISNFWPFVWSKSPHLSLFIQNLQQYSHLQNTNCNINYMLKSALPSLITATIQISFLQLHVLLFFFHWNGEDSYRVSEESLD